MNGLNQKSKNCLSRTAPKIIFLTLILAAPLTHPMLARRAGAVAGPLGTRTISDETLKRLTTKHEDALSRSVILFRLLDNHKKFKKKIQEEIKIYNNPTMQELSTLGTYLRKYKEVETAIRTDLRKANQTYYRTMHILRDARENDSRCF